MNVVEITAQNAKELLIDESFKRPVVVNFWAEWSAPCKVVKPLLEKIANEYAGAFLSASVNAEELSSISSQFGVQDLPTVVVMKDGQPIDGLTGAMPEIKLRELLEKYLPKPWEQPFNDAKAFMVASNYTDALPLLRRVYEESKHLHDVACVLVECHLYLNRIDNAEAILSTIKLADQDAQYEKLLAQIELKKQAAKTPELLALEAAHAADVDNLEVCYQLAVQYNQDSAYRAALELLITVLRKDRNFGNGQARKTLTDILTALGKGDPLAVEFQRKLFALLY